MEATAPSITIITWRARLREEDDSPSPSDCGTPTAWTGNEEKRATSELIILKSQGRFKWSHSFSLSLSLAQRSAILVQQALKRWLDRDSWSTRITLNHSLGSVSALAFMWVFDELIEGRRSIRQRWHSLFEFRAGCSRELRGNEEQKRLISSS